MAHQRDSARASSGWLAPAEGELTIEGNEVTTEGGAIIVGVRSLGRIVGRRMISVSEILTVLLASRWSLLIQPKWAVHPLYGLVMRYSPKRSCLTRVIHPIFVLVSRTPRVLPYLHIC